MLRIIYEGKEGVLALLDPDMHCGLSVLDIGKKDVPKGVPFWIVDVSGLVDIPVEAWEIDSSVLPDGVGEAA